jgi:hypothetical protein
MKSSPFQPALNGGEISPLLLARVDLEKYGLACRELLNFLPLKEGPIGRRPGVQHMGDTKAAGSRSWLVPFVFGRRDAWVLELSPAVLRLWHKGGLVESAPSTPYEVATPWQAIDLEGEPGHFAIASAQARDRVWLAGGGWRPRLLERSGATDWALSPFLPLDGPFDPENTDKTATVYASGTFTAGGAVSLVPSSAGVMPLSPNADGTFNHLVRLFKAPGAAARPWEAGISVAANDVRTSDGKYYLAINAGTTGGIRPVHTAGRAFDRATSGVEWEYLHPGYGVVQVTGKDGSGHYTGTVIERLPADVGSGSPTYRWQVSPWGSPFVKVAVDAATLTTLNADATKQVAYHRPSTSTNALGQTIRLDGSGAGWPFTFGAPGKITRVYSGATLFAETLVQYVDGSGRLWGLLIGGSVVGQSLPGAGSTTVAFTGWQYGDQVPAERWPTAVGFAFSRLVFGRGNRLWFSRTDDFGSFADRSFGQVLADDALSLTLTGREVTRIHWLEETAAGLVVGTDGGEFLVTKANTSQVFGAVTDGARNVEVVRHGTGGVAAIPPALAQSKALIVDASGSAVLELDRRLEVDRLEAVELTAMAGHILGPGARWLAWQGKPDNVLWVGRADGSLVSLTYLPEHKVVAFARHHLAPSDGEPAEVEHGTVIPSNDGTRAELWLVVRRKVNGSWVRHVERLGGGWVHGLGLGPQDARHVDSWLAYDGAPTSTIGGLGHLEGEAVEGVADGFVVGPLTVTSGSVTLPAAASKVVLGLGFASRCAFLVPEAQGQEGPGVGKLRRARELVATVLESGDRFRAGVLETLRLVTGRSAQLPLGEVPPLLSGDIRVPLDLGRARPPNDRRAPNAAGRSRGDPGATRASRVEPRGHGRHRPGAPRGGAGVVRPRGRRTDRRGRADPRHGAAGDRLGAALGRGRPASPGAHALGAARPGAAAHGRGGGRPALSRR